MNWNRYKIGIATLNNGSEIIIIKKRFFIFWFLWQAFSMDEYDDAMLLYTQLPNDKKII